MIYEIGYAAVHTECINDPEHIEEFVHILWDCPSGAAIVPYLRAKISEYCNKYGYRYEDVIGDLVQIAHADGFNEGY